MFHLSIDKPCQKNRDNFLKTKNGGFCSSCQKEVIDFTKMTDKEVRDYFKFKANRNTCGMLKASQIKTYYPEQYKKQSIWLGATILGGILSLLPIDGKGQSVLSFDVYKTEQTPAPKNLPVIYDSLTLSGVVYSIHDKSALPGINVILKGTNIGAVTDIDGKYSFDIPSDTVDYIIEFSFIGLKSVEKKRSDIQSNSLVVYMEESLEILGELVVVGGVGYSKPFSVRNWFGIRTLGRKIAGIFRR